MATAKYGSILKMKYPSSAQMAVSQAFGISPSFIIAI